MKWEVPAEFPYQLAHERSHFPGPVRAMDFGMSIKAMEHGFNRALMEYRLPLQVIDLHINTFVYEALVSRELSKDPSDSSSRPAAMVLQIAIDNLADLWADVWLPEINDHLAFWANFDLLGASRPQLASHFAHTQERCRAMWEVHFRLFFPMLLAISQFHSLCAEVPVELSPSEVATLLTGTPSKTTQGDEALWALGRQARKNPEIVSTLRQSPWPEARRRLQKVDQGQHFVDCFESYLDDFGRRGSDWSIDRPFWIEDPSPPLAMLQEYASAAEAERAAHATELAQSRAALLARCETRLRAASHPILPAFRRLLGSARAATWLSEESYHWIEGLGSYSVRRVCIEVGERLARVGVLEHADDVFHLQPQEALKAIAGATGTELEKRVATRKIQVARAADIEPPAFVGIPGDIPQPPAALGQALDLFFGAPIESSEDEALVRGHGASPGVARGPVRRVESLAQAHDVELGDVLVAPTTSPAWTPLFRSIAGLVTDTGGTLCHAAIVAREYGLPAVVGTGRATRALCDGQLVEVDGHRGTVRIVDAEARDTV